jgi:hypothetical protein
LFRIVTLQNITLQNITQLDSSVKLNLGEAILAPTPQGKTYLLYLQESDLFGQEFEERSGTLRGKPVLVVTHEGLGLATILQEGLRHGSFGLGSLGVLVIPPALGYVFLFRVVPWIMEGFRKKR